MVHCYNLKSNCPTKNLVFTEECATRITAKLEGRKLCLLFALEEHIFSDAFGINKADQNRPRFLYGPLSCFDIGDSGFFH